MGETRPPASSSSGGGPSTASLLGGAALVGAAAGYALLAMKFRSFGSGQAGRFSAGSAEFRAAQAFSKEWSRSAAPAFEEAAEQQQPQHAARGANRAARKEYERWKQRSQQQQQQQQKQQRQQEQHAKSGPPAWALTELGLPAAPVTLADAKAAYRRRAKLVHPDTTSSARDDTAFQRLTEALKAVEPHALKT